jgi:hypothetical protein
VRSGNKTAFSPVGVLIRIWSGCSKKRARSKQLAPSILNYLALLLAHALQRAQQSAESQHDAFAAFTDSAKPSAITAINTNAFSFFMNFSPLKNQM